MGEATEMLLTVPEAAAWLRVSPSAVYALCEAGKIRHSRVGLGRGTIRLRPEDVRAYLERRTVDPEDDRAPAQAVAPRRPARRRVSRPVAPL